MGYNDKQYFLFTYGCQMNIRDSETIAGLLEGMGYRAAEFWQQADVIILNTCSVRHSAENKVYGKLGEINVQRRKNPDLILALGGCMAQLPSVKSKLKKLGVDVVFGTHNIHELPALLIQAKERDHQVYQVWEQAGSIVEGLPANRQQGLTAFVNVMYGCNNFCSYCIVPYTRGRERSRDPRDIIAEIQLLADQGYQEVTLLGQNVNSYGKGLDLETDFADLLSAANKVDGLKRIRFTTSHPKDMSDKLIAAIAEESKVCEHIHVPLQSGSDSVLAKMNRGYTREQYWQLVQKIRQIIPGAAITSDLIVGFPGESEEDFINTLDMVRKVEFDSAFTFMYSPRAGTRAAMWEENLSRTEKSRRLQCLNEIQYMIAKKKNQALAGTDCTVLVESVSKTDPDKLTGRTRTNRIVNFSGSKDLIGQEINVKIVSGGSFSLEGKYI